MVGHFAEETDARVVVIQVHPDSEASAAVPTRAAFRYLGERVAPSGERMLTFAKTERSILSKARRRPPSTFRNVRHEARPRSRPRAALPDHLCADLVADCHLHIVLNPIL